MGRAKIAESSEIAHFRVDTADKRALEAHAKKLGKKKKFSDLARDAIKEYIRKLQEEELLSEAKKDREDRFAFYYQVLSQNLSDLEKSETDLEKWLLEKRMLGPISSYANMFRALDDFIHGFQKTLHDFPWGLSPESRESLPLEVAKQVFTTKLAWVRQTLLLHYWMSDWSKQKKERERREAAAIEFIDSIKGQEKKGGVINQGKK